MAPKRPFRHPRYEIARILGKGGMGTVYLARDLLEEGREVALKLYPARCHHERLREEFLALRSIHHPGIARALHFGLSESDGAPFFTMEHVEGDPLDRHLDALGAARGPVEGTESARFRAALELFTAAAGILSHLHRRGVLHLDLKPANILVAPAGEGLAPQPVFIDFGLVRTSKGPETLIGHATIPFAPPEAFTGEPPSAASDVYSLGAAFYFLFSGRCPVECSSFASALRAHRTSPPAPIPEAPAALGRLILRTLAKDPRRRFRDGGELYRALLRPPITQLLGEGRSTPAVVFHEPDFVGRKRELESLERWLARDRRRCPVFEVSAASGFGKTRFIEKAGSLLESRRKRVLLLRVEGGGDTLLVRAARSAAFLAPAGPSRRVRSLEDIDGYIRAAARGGSAAEEAAGAFTRALSSRLLSFLRDDTFLLIDDVHRATPLEERFLEGLAMGLGASPEAPGGGILASRGVPDGGMEEETPWRKGGIAAGARLDAFSIDEALEIDLEGLDGALAATSPEKVRALKTALFREVAGHPLFYVRGLLDLAGDPAGATRLAPTERVLAQVKRLEPGALRAALALASIGRSASDEEVAGALAASRTSARGWLKALARLGLLAIGGSGARIVHESLARAILQEVSAAERSEIEERIAVFLARAPDGARLLEAAWHFFRARRGQKGLEAAREWLDRGALRPRAALEDAVRALSLAAEEAGRRTPLRERLLEAGGDVLEGIGRYEECMTLRSDLVHEMEDGRRAPTADLVRRMRKLGVAAHRAGRLDLALEHLGRSAEAGAAEAAPVESLRARADLALLHHFCGQSDLALEHSRKGIEAWKRSSTEDRDATIQSAINFHAVLGQVRIRRLHFDGAIRVLEDGLKLSRKMRSPANTANLLNNLALANHLAGRFGIALDTFRRAAAIAKELGDPAALVSIEANVAQVLARKGRFRAARAILEEIEASPAVEQSRRLRFGCLYTRGLLLHLAGEHADELWSAVEKEGAEVGDSFLVRFARLHRAEGKISAGELSAARTLLAEDEELRGKCGAEPGSDNEETDASGAILGMLRMARLALVEALAGNTETARALRKASLSARPRMPLPLRAWNLVYAGVSAMETADLVEAAELLEDAREVFRSMGFAAGELECALVLADLHLRSVEGGPVPGTGPLRSLLRAERELRVARKVHVEPLAEMSPRQRDLRAALLEARIVLHRCAPRREGRKKAKKARRGTTPEPSLTLLQDILLRSAGDPALSLEPDLRLVLEALSAAAARLGGDLESARAAVERMERIRKEAEELLDPADRESRRGRDPWLRFGLTAFRPLEGDGSLDASHAAALASIASTLCRADGREPFERAAAEIARATRGSRVELSFRGGLIASCGPEPRAGEDLLRVRVLSASSRFHGTVVGAVIARAALDGRFIASDETFIDAAAQALAPHLAALSIPGSKSRSPGRGGPAAARADTSAFPSPGALLETSSLGHTKRLGARSFRTGALAQFLRSRGFIAAGQEMLKVLRALRSFAPTDLPVLITGESGTGKNLVARTLHDLSPRAANPFHSQNASAVPAELFEADFFGHEAGAFTGADRARTGFLFQAAAGTFHLEEVGDLDLTIQQRLLHVIEEGRVRPLGSTAVRALDVRFIASTQRDLDAMVRRGTFRKDLFFRLNGARIHIPPLRERRDEIADIVAHYWRELTGSTGRFSAPALEALLAHDWPGNVRELISVLRRVSLEAPGMPGEKEVRAALGHGEKRRLFSPSLFETRTFEEVERSLEESYLLHLHAKHAGDLGAIAAALETTTRSVYRRFEKLGLKPKDLKSR